MKPRQKSVNAVAPVPAQVVPTPSLEQRSLQKAKEYWHMLGPGLTTGASDDDPSGIATYSQTGAQYGYQMLWLAAFTFPLMAVVQEMCARIGLVTGRGLAGNIRRYYPRWVLYVCATLLFVANTFNIGADLGAMAKATQLLAPGTNFVGLVLLFALGSVLLQILTPYARYAKYLKYLALVLFSYVFTAFVIHINWREVLVSGILPRMGFDREHLLLLTAILGTTISPYLFFWQTSQEVEEQIMQGKTSIKARAKETTDVEVKDMRIDVWSGMFLSNLVMFFIIATCAATLHGAGANTIRTAADAAEALRPLAGQAAFLLFAIGILGTGLLSLPVLAGSASYALSESFGWREGLYLKFRQAHAFYGVIIVAMILGLVMNFIGLDPIKALIYSAVVNGLVAPVVLVLIIGMSGNKKIMGGRVNGRVAHWFGWIITVFMIIAGVATIVSLFM